MSETGTTSSRSVDIRRYHITGILGRGGFGTVYRGRLDGGEGFVKDVAIKLLSDEDPDDEVLSRFRDEARILGLLRDRNIVSVDPPTRLGGRWAVVMEFVDGADCSRLLEKLGSLPIIVALEIIEEVARTLDNLWTHLGTDGEPLHLLHRDIKPANIQVTPNGQVKVLDFGIAKASFGGREARTTDHIGGTRGYIAPERLEGEEGDRGDVYSLGVVLHELVTGHRPKPSRKLAPDPDPYRQSVIELGIHMRQMEPEDRPSAREVEKRCRALRSEGVGSDLRDWSKANVPHASTIDPDDLVGTQLTETIHGIPLLVSDVPVPAPRKSNRGLIFGVAAVLTVLIVVGGGALLAALGVGGSFVLLRGAEQPQAPPTLVGATPEAEEPIEEPVEGPDGEEPDEPEVPEPDAPAEVRPAPAPTPPAPVPAPAPEPPAESGTVVVTGDAESVWFTGPGGRFEAGSVPAGSYEVQAIFGGKEVHAGRLTVTGGATATLKCMSAFKRCQNK